MQVRVLAPILAWWLSGGLEGTMSEKMVMESISYRLGGGKLVKTYDSVLRVFRSPMEQAMAINIVDIIVERRGKILLTKKGDFWIVPGAAIEDGETELECLDRVVAAEINDQVSSIFKKLDETVRGHSPVRHGDVEVSIYVGDVSTKKMSDIRDCNAHWFARESIRAIRISNITRDVLNCYFRFHPDDGGSK